MNNAHFSTVANTLPFAYPEIWACCRQAFLILIFLHFDIPLFSKFLFEHPLKIGIYIKMN